MVMSRRKASSSGVPKLSVRMIVPSSVSTSSYSDRLRKVETSTIFPPLKKTWTSRNRTTNDPAVSKRAVTSWGWAFVATSKSFGYFSQKKIPDASSNEVGQKTVVMETIENLEGFFIDLFSRNRMIGSWNNGGSDLFIPLLVLSCSESTLFAPDPSKKMLDK